MTLEDFNNKISGSFCVAVFSAPWCGDCRRIDPVVKELESEFSIVKVNIDEDENLSTHFNIRRIPTFVFFKDGKEVGTRLIEPKSKVEILNQINDAKNS